jgi:DNA invertase Pin-like site-specific DNA recombinase
MRVSSDSDRQTTDLQRDALLAAGVEERHLFEGHASGAKDDRPGLISALASMRPGDVLVVRKLDRLGRPLSHLTTQEVEDLYSWPRTIWKPSRFSKAHRPSPGATSI